MSKRKVYISLILVGFISIIIYSTSNFNRINYIRNTIKGFIFNYNDKPAAPKDEFKIIDPANYKKYIKTYANLPKSFVHFGNFLFYNAKRGDTVRDIAKKSIVYTRFYKLYKLREAIRDYNGIRNNTIGKNMLVFIPYSLPAFLTDMKRLEKPAIIYTRGLYYSGNSIGSQSVLESISKFRKVGINSIVFDVKDITGIVNYFSHVPDVLEYNTHEKRTIDDIDKLIRILKQEKIYTIARIAVFRDHLLCRKNPGLAIRSKSTGNTWNAGSKEIWCDPTNKRVQDYNIGLAIELSRKGVDEIQFDYIRFPTVGNLNDAAYSYHFGRMSKEAAITHFLKRAYREISRRNTRLSVDIFGVVAWSKEVDIRKTGQRVESLSKYCDIISPMLYPSHFNDDFEGFPSPGDEPFYFIYNGCKRTDRLSNGKVVRPWLQAFKWRVSSYNEDYILKQIIGCREGGGFGYLFWNAKNNYDVVYRALLKLVSMKEKKAGNPPLLKSEAGLSYQ